MAIRTNIPGTSPYEPTIGFSRAVRIGDQIHVSGTGPVGADNTGIAEQTDQCLTLIASALKQAGSSIEHVYRTRIYLTHVQDWEAAAQVHGKFFSLIRPAATIVVVAALLNPSWRVEIEAEAQVPDGIVTEEIDLRNRIRQIEARALDRMHKRHTDPSSAG
jgi:enamine deaminase RidA (YjgF/YER057c/UK114 family)